MYLSPKNFLSLEGSSLMCTGLMSNFEGSSTIGCSNVDWRLISFVSSWLRFLFEDDSLEYDGDALDRWDWSQRLPTILEDWMLLSLSSSSKSWYLKWWSMPDSSSSSWYAKWRLISESKYLQLSFLDPKEAAGKWSKQSKQEHYLV